LAPIVAILRRLASHNAAISGRYRVEPDHGFARPRILEQGGRGTRGKIMSYRHTQRGTLILIMCLAAAGFGLAMSWRSGHWPPALIILIVMIVMASLFSSLTIEVAGNESRWYFGLGLISYRLGLDEIRDVAIVRNHWWNGWGIRMRPGFRLYNVSGLDAVELRLTSNDIRRIGTDDPEGLVKVLRAHRGPG
jgi:hypothetical protein